jgi:hypothetical protein
MMKHSIHSVTLCPIRVAYLLVVPCYIAWSALQLEAFPLLKSWAGTAAFLGFPFISLTFLSIEY